MCDEQVLGRVDRSWPPHAPDELTQRLDVKRREWKRGLLEVVRQDQRHAAGGGSCTWPTVSEGRCGDGVQCTPAARAVDHRDPRVNPSCPGSSPARPGPPSTSATRPPSARASHSSTPSSRGPTSRATWTATARLPRWPSATTGPRACWLSLSRVQGGAVCACLCRVCPAGYGWWGCADNSHTRCPPWQHC